MLLEVHAPGFAWHPQGLLASVGPCCKTLLDLFRKAMDSLTPEARSRLMARIGGKGTKPELAVRSLLHRMGLRFRLHDRMLPGSPDIVLRRHRTVVFVHGCFWHRHGCRMTTTPKTRKEFWQQKFDANVARDERSERKLEELGWRVLVVWECETRDLIDLERRLGGFFFQGVDPSSTKP
ncbi:very short patch repair endonuclease [Variovorax paradoxus]|uniref:very short patch repair endonuclease n=2 Tax=Variovorax paradoxus TaxID=34073 RepID=UPI0039955C52